MRFHIATTICALRPQLGSARKGLANSGGQCLRVIRRNRPTALSFSHNPRQLGIGIGGREDPVRLDFDTDAGPGVVVAMSDMRDRFRLTANTVDDALARVADSAPQAMLVDYHLHDRLDGLDTLDVLRNAAGSSLPGALLTADGRDELKRLTRQRGYQLLTKPVKPASLRAWASTARLAR